MFKKIITKYILFLFTLNMFIFNVNAIDVGNNIFELEGTFEPPQTTITTPTTSLPIIINDNNGGGSVNVGGGVSTTPIPFTTTITGSGEKIVFTSMGVKVIRLNQKLFNNDSSNLLDKIIFTGPYGDEINLKNEIITNIKNNLNYFESKEITINEILDGNLFFNESNKCFYLNKFYKEGKPIFIGYDKYKLDDTFGIFNTTNFTEDLNDDIYFYSNVLWDNLGVQLSSNEKLDVYRSVYKNFILKQTDTYYLTIANNYGISGEKLQNLIGEVILDGLINEYIKKQLSYNSNFVNSTNNNKRTNPSPGMVEIETYTSNYFKSDFFNAIEKYESAKNHLNFLSGATDFQCSDTKLKTKLIYISDEGNINFSNINTKIIGDGNILGLDFIRGDSTTFEYYTDKELIDKDGNKKIFKSSKGYTKTIVCGVLDLLDDKITCKLINTTLTDDPGTVENEQIVKTYEIPLSGYNDYKGKDMFDKDGYFMIKNKKYKVDLANDKLEYIGNETPKTNSYWFNLKQSISLLIDKILIKTNLSNNIAGDNGNYYSCQDNKCYMFKDQNNIKQSKNNLQNKYLHPSIIPLEYNDESVILIIGKGQ